MHFNNDKTSKDSQQETSRFIKNESKKLFPLKDPGIDFFQKVLNSYKFVEDIEEQEDKFFKIDKCEIVKESKVPQLQILKKRSSQAEKKGSARSVISERKLVKSQREKDL